MSAAPPGTVERRRFAGYGLVDLIVDEDGAWYGQRADTLKVTARLYGTRPALVKALHDGNVRWR